MVLDKGASYVHLDQILQQFAERWQVMLFSIYDLLLENHSTNVAEIHEEVIGIANRYGYSGHDIAMSLKFLLQIRCLAGRFSYVILVFEHEWVKAAKQGQVYNLYDYLRQCFSHESGKSSDK